MARTTNSDTLPFVDSRYELGMMAAQRVRDLNGGAEQVVENKGDKPTVIALREIATGKLDMSVLRHEFVQSYKDAPTSGLEDVSLEVNAEDPALRELDAELGDILMDVVEEAIVESDEKELEESVIDAE